MSARELRFITADVFTSRPFTGNPLAVVFDADGLDTDTLQAITREFNYAESTFVFASESGDPLARRVRIFTPEEELPFAGHPTIGTAHVLVASGEIALGAEGGVVTLEEGVGPVRVQVTMAHGLPVHCEFTTAVLPEERDAGVSRAALAEVLSLAESDVLDGDFAPRAVSCGLPWCLVPLATVDAVSRAVARRDVWERTLAGRWAAWPFVFAPRAEGDVDFQARAFLPASAVPEDPATGSANAALAGYLGVRTPRDGTLSWHVSQGVEMGRASRLSLSVDKARGAITAVRVGGDSRIVMRGTLRV
jgi:trans-2,3-dihydro-3-hydroxyanthranilate isomerase